MTKNYLEIAGNETIELKDSESNKLACPLLTVRIKLKKIQKKAFRLELLELCQFRSKKSSPDMLKFSVILLGHEMITDAGKATTHRRKFKAP